MGAPIRTIRTAPLAAAAAALTLAPVPMSAQEREPLDIEIFPPPKTPVESP